jgi:hypothetical protein
MIVGGYSLWCKKPLAPVLLTSIVANIITHSFLWVILNLFFQHYLVTLLIAEVLIWLLESFLLYRFPANRLGLKEAAVLSLCMNMASFGFGWFLPT